MTIIRLLCQLVALPLCLIGLGLAYLGSVFCRAARGISGVVKP